MIRIGNHPEGMSPEELKAYERHANDKYPRINGKVDIKLDGEYAELTYYADNAVPFQRIRRITGYLTGTVDRWNNAKKAELSDRVKHETDYQDRKD